jgi:hypothetical protein
MAHNYGGRYITVEQFIRYCADLNVETDKRELEHYEKAGIMLPVARVLYPEDYARLRALWPLGGASEPPRLDQWPELHRLFDKPRARAEEYADLQDEDLIDSFDREMGRNPCLIRPTPEAFRPWDSYTVLVPYRDGQQHAGSTADHRYSYWQVHQLHFIQRYPDLYKNKALLEQIPDEVKRRNFRPQAPRPDIMHEFRGLARCFDALSFWIVVYNREHERTFALVAEKHQVKRLDATQLQAYRQRLAADGKLVQGRYGIAVDDLYRFLRQLVDLYHDYRVDEHYKLSHELRNDVIHQAQLIEVLTGLDWEAIAEELGRRGTFWTKQEFRHMDVLVREHDEARELLTYYATMYGDALGKLGIAAPTRTFAAAEIDELVEYCGREGPPILLTALSGMVATEDEYAEKFRRASRYSNLKNASTALEYLLKDLAARGRIELPKPTLNPVIQKVMQNERWITVFIDRTRKGLTGAKESAEFFASLNELVCDAELMQSEDAYWARAFLIASLARNLTVHAYPDDDWFYGELFGEMLRATIYAVLYSWQVAKERRWV